ncbi:hypothetical protein HK096_000389 [Nowakowskiella sp. JEL0078]|nr:hypothetical protein HK096_000389 [Nowakowskiella sp. JEL0078]
MLGNSIFPMTFSHPFPQSNGNFTGLLSSGQYADAYIRLSTNAILKNQENTDVLVHKVILAGQTPFFADLFASAPCEFKLKSHPSLSNLTSQIENTVHSSIGVWTLQIDYIENFKTVMEWMYTSNLAFRGPCTKFDCSCNFSNEISSLQSRFCSLQKAWGVLKLACNFGLPKLIETVEMNILLSFVKTPYNCFEEEHWFRIVIDAMNSGASTKCIKMIITFAVNRDSQNGTSILPSQVDNKEIFEKKLEIFNKKIIEFQIKNSNITKEKQDLLFNVLWSEINIATSESAFAQLKLLLQKPVNCQYERPQSWPNFNVGFGLSCTKMEAESSNLGCRSSKLNNELNVRCTSSPSRDSVSKSLEV